MGLFHQGSSRIRWVGFLVVVLALTASRANFPLLNAARSALLGSAGTLSYQNQRNERKSEGVIPSRRAVESRRLAPVQSNQAELSPWMSGDALALDNGGVLGTGLRTRSNSFDTASDTRPDYLQLFLRASAVSSLPPPL